MQVEFLTKEDLDDLKKCVLSALENAKKIQDNEPPYLNLEQAAKYIGVKASTLGEMVRNGEISYIKVGLRIMFRRVDLDAYMMNHRVMSNAEIASLASVKG